MTNNSKLSITGGKGFAITTDNGVTVSVQFGSGNYCDNRTGLSTSENAEVAVWFADGKWHNWGSDDVVGYVPANEVSRLIGYCQSFDPTLQEKLYFDIRR